MAYFNFENGVTSINDTNLIAMQKGLMELVFPVGSTYTTQTNTNPSTILGFGTWERLKGIIPLGLDEDDEDLNEIGKTGGEKEHTLTVEEMTKHSHKNWHNQPISVQRYSNGDPAWPLFEDTTFNKTTEEVGESKPFNIMQPFKVVGYMWLRTA